MLLGHLAFSYHQCFIQFGVYVARQNYHDNNNTTTTTNNNSDDDNNNSQFMYVAVSFYSIILK